MTDWLLELDDSDLETLIDALEAWESKDMAGDIMGTLLDSVLSQKHRGMPADVSEQRRRDVAEREANKRMRKERSVLLRAKLLTIRDRRRAERMTHEALSRQ